MPLYDVNFTLACPACFVIEATSAKHARELAMEELANMPNTELWEYITAALEYRGTKITFIKRID